MAINVKSEIKPLKKVLLHRPGKELLNLTPDTLERLLFDDIPFLKVAQQEHDAFAQILKENGVEVVYLEDLAAETISQCPDLKKQFLEQFITEGGVLVPEYREALMKLFESYTDNKELIMKTMEGVKYGELKLNSDSLISKLIDENELILDPMPNLYFTRDPFASIGHGVSLNKMYSVTRNRETIYADYIFKHHNDYKGKVPYFYERDNQFHIEGGDILNLNDKVLAIGISQRTQAAAIDQIAKNIFDSSDSSIKTILAFKIPETRAFMHLDTVFTQIDHDKFTIHPNIMGPLEVYELTKNGNKIEVKLLQDTLKSILEKYLGVPNVTLIKCGGEDRIAAEREQWNDGSNTLCIAPGVIVVYERNDVTNELLRRAGLKVLEMPSAELSRGRGGPRCMSMPLVRED
ncbi:arginine deiminase [Pseudoleptotrichia goodfellowii]|uniref:Arginine deiminase n=1 Tax=Pseudoleptotrichia goodfellowii F0264 TaxID=596323 RepID=D0GJ92_9FUSO|nr:arginine deiminase [Pseudoleptotrichia goodfellowii]EEY35853.1 arginine deiminase [Pseudoleptotrichia goodfellowii F0264]